MLLIIIFFQPFIKFSDGTLWVHGFLCEPVCITGSTVTNQGQLSYKKKHNLIVLPNWVHYSWRDWGRNQLNCSIPGTFLCASLHRQKELSETGKSERERERVRMCVCVYTSVCIFASKETPPWRQQLKPAAVTYKQCDLIWWTDNVIELVRLHSQSETVSVPYFRAEGTK